MSLLIQAQTSDDDEEIAKCIELVLNTAKMGLIHESLDVNYSYSYTSKQPGRMRPAIRRRTYLT